MQNHIEADIIILGGGLGGCAAALAAAKAGKRVIMTEESDWLGGQITSQGVPPDELFAPLYFILNAIYILIIRE